MVRHRYVIDFNTDEQKETIIKLITLYNLQIEEGDYLKYGLGNIIDNVIEIKNEYLSKTSNIGPTKSRLIYFSNNDSFTIIQWWLSINLRTKIYELNENINIYDIDSSKINLDNLTDTSNKHILLY